MTFTLQRYIFRELMKVFSFAAVALTLILSLGSVLRPVQEYGVGPGQVIHLLGYFLPITLTFVLPMAALFSAALIYGRFASDNELDACKASGISMLTLIYPGLVLAIIVAIANLLLSFHTVPAFVHRAQKSLKGDAKQILFRNIQRSDYYELPGREYRIRADYADMQNDTLLGVVIAQIKDLGIERIITADNAKIQFNSHGKYNEVRITAYNTYQMGREAEGGFSAECVPISKEFPPLLGDNIKFKKINEIKKIAVDPILFYPIEKQAHLVYSQFTVELLAKDIADKISDDSNKFYRLNSARKYLLFTASRCEIKKEEQLNLSGDVMVAEYDTDSGEHLCNFRCVKAVIKIEGDRLAPTLTMVLYDAIWKSPDGLIIPSQRHVIRGLVLPATVTEQFKSESVLEAIAPENVAESLDNEPSQYLVSLQTKLRREIASTLSSIKAETHSRLVFGVGCVPMILIGIGLGIIKKGGHLLSAFGVSCLPAGLLLICIIAGRNMTKNIDVHGGFGIYLMWIGLAILMLLLAVIYRRLIKY